MADTYMMASFSVVLLNLKSTHGFTCTYKLQIPHTRHCVQSADVL